MTDTVQPYITKIVSNIKQMADPVLLHQPRVLLSGRNGSGKSARLNAIQLALLGQADDVIGRDSVKTTSLLRELDAKGIVHSTVTMSDGNQAIWTLGQGGKPKHSPLPYPVHQPLRAALDALAGSRATTVRYLYNAFGPEDDRVKAEVGARKQMNEHKKVVKACQSVLDGLGITGLPQPKDDLIRAIGTLTKYQIEQNKTICGTCGGKASIHTFQGRYDRISEKLSDLPPLTSDALRGLLAARDEAQRRVAISQKKAEEHMRVINAWFHQYRKKIETKLSTGPLGPVGIKADSKSYLLIGRKSADDLVWPVVSGAESVVLAVTLAKAARRYEGLNLMIVPDRAFDTNMLRALLKLTASCLGTNVFVQSVMTPKMVPTHWESVRLDK